MYRMTSNTTAAITEDSAIVLRVATSTAAMLIHDNSTCMEPRFHYNAVSRFFTHAERYLNEIFAFYAFRF